MIEELYIRMTFLIFRIKEMQIYKFTTVRFFIGLTENGGNGGKFEFVKVSTQICSSF